MKFKTEEKTKIIEDKFAAGVFQKLTSSYFTDPVYAVRMSVSVQYKGVGRKIFRRWGGNKNTASINY